MYLIPKVDTYPYEAVFWSLWRVHSRFMYSEGTMSIDAVQSFMSEYSISMQLMKMSQNRRIDISCQEVDRYKCQLTRPGKEIDVYVAVPPEEGEITPFDVFYMLILDASGCEMFKDYYARHEEFNRIFDDYCTDVEGLDEFWREYESRCKQSQKLRTFLGKNLYEELIVQFGFQD